MKGPHTFDNINLHSTLAERGSQRDESEDRLFEFVGFPSFWVTDIFIRYPVLSLEPWTDEMYYTSGLSK